MRILVVDDDPIFRDELTELLRDEGHQVAGAPSVQKGEEALEADEFDVVLTDLKMPRRGGMDLVRSVRARWPRTLVVVVTGYASVDTALEAMKLGAFDYVRKPFRLDQIRATLALAAQEHEFAAPQGTQRDPAREARALASSGKYEVLFIGDAARARTPHLTVVPMDTLEPATLLPLVDGFLADHPGNPAVVIASLDRWLATHRMEPIVELLDELRRRLNGRGPLRVGFDPDRVAPAVATAVGSAVAAEETHGTLEALANPIRRKVLQRLSEGPAKFGDAMRAAALDESPKFAFHLRKLTETGLVIHEDEVYRLSARGEAAVRLIAAAAFLPPAGDAVNQAFPKRPG